MLTALYACRMPWRREWARKQKLHAVRAQRGVRHDGAHDALREQPEHVERAAQVEGHEEQHAERGRKTAVAICQISATRSF